MNKPLTIGKENEKRWLIFDGDVDALWIENMNSVMDDNKLLTLPNGERIQLQPYSKLIMKLLICSMHHQQRLVVVVWCG